MSQGELCLWPFRTPHLLYQTQVPHHHHYAMMPLSYMYMLTHIQYKTINVYEEPLRGKALEDNNGIRDARKGVKRIHF